MSEMLASLCPIVAMIVGKKADSDDKAELRAMETTAAT
jgi:hypothetical protein